MTNPLTYVPVYATAYLLGCFLIGHDPAQLTGTEAGFAGLWEKLETLASTSRIFLSAMIALFLGALVLASLAAVIADFAVHSLWGHMVRRAWRRRRAVLLTGAGSDTRA